MIIFRLGDNATSSTLNLQISKRLTLARWKRRDELITKVLLEETSILPQYFGLHPFINESTLWASQSESLKLSFRASLLSCSISCPSTELFWKAFSYLSKFISFRHWHTCDTVRTLRSFGTSERDEKLMLPFLGEFRGLPNLIAVGGVLELNCLGLGLAAGVGGLFMLISRVDPSPWLKDLRFSRSAFSSLPSEAPLLFSGLGELGFLGEVLLTGNTAALLWGIPLSILDRRRSALSFSSCSISSRESSFTKGGLLGDCVWGWLALILSTSLYLGGGGVKPTGGGGGAPGIAAPPFAAPCFDGIVDSGGGSGGFCRTWGDPISGASCPFVLKLCSWS